MRWVFLVGFMGVGKTTLGRDVASRLRLPFFDLDARIEQTEDKSIAEIFKAFGETGFRERETAALRELLAHETPGIVATGGGAFAVSENRTMMEIGISVWLDAPVESIARRLGASRDERPMWTSENEARALATARKKHYRLASHHLHVGDNSANENAGRLYELLASTQNNS